MQQWATLFGKAGWQAVGILTWGHRSSFSVLGVIGAAVASLRSNTFSCLPGQAGNVMLNLRNVNGDLDLYVSQTGR